MKKNYILISEVDGFNFSDLSKDKNAIHIDNKIGYNSIYGNKIVHGVLVLMKIFEKIKFPNIFFSIEIIFKSNFNYDIPIKIFKFKKNKNVQNYKLIQEKNVKALFSIFTKKKDQIYFNEEERLNFKKKTYNVNNNIKFKNIYTPINFNTALSYLSRYVGTIYPGKHSLINKIIIEKTISHKYKNIVIKSSKKDPRFSRIYNRLYFADYKILFETFIRPTLKIKLKKPSYNFLKKIKSINRNILIIGGSSGIGNDLLKLFLLNKKIKIIATYFNNPIKINRKNLLVKKIDINKDIKLIEKIIKLYHPISLYYFATPRISINSVNKNIKKDYEKYFIKFPLDIIKKIKNEKCNFFYPSSTYVDSLKSNIYSRSKLMGENKLKKINKSNIKINILRIKEVNTKQNLSLLSKKLPNFRDLLFENHEYQGKLFFYE